MLIGNFNRLMLRGGLTLAAALMVTTAVFGQDQPGPGEDIVLNPIDIVVDDGLEIGVGGWPDVPVGDGSGDGFDGGAGTGDDGTGAGDVGAGTGDVGAGTGDDGTGAGDVGAGTGDDGTGAGDVGAGTGDVGAGDVGVGDVGAGTGDDGTGADTGTGTGDGVGVVDEGEVVIYYLDGGPVLCADCEVGITGLPVEAYQSDAVGPLAAGNAAPAAKPRASARQPIAASNMADCLALHPQLPWICEWQNGAGQ